MELFLCSGLFLPLAGFLFLLAGHRFLSRRTTGIVACGTIFIAFLSFLKLLYDYPQDHPLQEVTLFSWIHIKGFDADFSLHLDHLSLLMTLIVTGVGFLIHLFSIGYMDHDEDFARFFACLNFFIFSMLLLVLASHLLLFFVGWEGVGLASYLLIGFWYTKPSASKAAKKAFIVNRIGDLGLLLGLLLTFHTFGTGNIAEICRRTPLEFAIGAPVITAITLLYFWGATAKSAQLPLHVWLPDAMEGPTPVSALIHAATMVTAGVYLVVRMNPLYTAAPFVLELIGYVGAITSLYAALCALSQKDIKRVLAFSTISQLGLMFLACGAGAYFAAMFHLTTHAFVKALLFLSAGNVVHMLGGETDMAKMGGLSQKLPKTSLLFLIGTLALAGIPPLAAFFSKDLILEEESLTGHTTLYLIGLLITALTGFYLMRTYLLTFKGKVQVESKLWKSLKEAPSIMIVPVSILALLSIFGGLLGYATNREPLLMAFLDKDSDAFFLESLATGFHLAPEAWCSFIAAIIGVGLAACIYTRLRDRLGKTIEFLYRSFYINELYFLLIVRPLKFLAAITTTIFEPKIFEGVIPASAHIANSTAKALQYVQSGQLRSYIAWIVIGSAILVLYFLSGGLFYV